MDILLGTESQSTVLSQIGDTFENPILILQEKRLILRATGHFLGGTSR